MAENGLFFLQAEWWMIEVAAEEGCNEIYELRLIYEGKIMDEKFIKAKI